ncbi:hypothetical protein [Cryptosporangium japonicum]|uniref:hypothetical protein n=1 Tax=Cryptosporangium japonicum TaxID=80872 RepID=UPI0031D50085
MFRQRSRVIALVAAVVGALAALTPSAAVGDQPPPSDTSTPSTFAWGAAVIDLPWTAAALPDGATCPGGRIAFTANGGNPQSGAATAGDHRYTITLVETVDVSADDAREAIVKLGCYDDAKGVSSEFYYLYYWHDDRPEVRDYITATRNFAGGRHLVKLVDGQLGSISLKQTDSTEPRTYSRTFTWTADGLVPDAPFAPFPAIDTAPA